MLDNKYTERMLEILGQKGFEMYLKSLKKTPVRAFHINNKKVSADAFLKLFPYDISPIPYLKDSYYFDIERIGNHPFHHAGMFYIQEPAAMFPVGSIDIKEDWKVLDMCASPGGKSSQIMQSLSENGQLVSNEIIPSRCKTLCSNIERLGYKNVTVTCASSYKIREIYENYFDLVVVDAPCSGEGMFRKEPNAVLQWSEENVLNCAQRQKTILDDASKCVVGGGYLLYSTCTFSLEENEKMITDFIKTHPNFTPVPLNDSCYDYTSDGIVIDNNNYYKNCMRRFYPHISKGEGQFAALLQNTDDKYERTSFSFPFRKPNINEQKIISKFINETLTGIDTDRLFMNEDKVVYCDESKLYPKKSYMCSVTIGQLQKGYIKPHHQLFSALGNHFINKVDFNTDDNDLKYYLQGGSFNVSANKGWNVVTVNGVALGGAKIVDGYLKNHYPKGLHLLK